MQTRWLPRKGEQDTVNKQDGGRMSLKAICTDLKLFSANREKQQSKLSWGLRSLYNDYNAIYMSLESQPAKLSMVIDSAEGHWHKNMLRVKNRSL